MAFSSMRTPIDSSPVELAGGGRSAGTEIIIIKKGSYMKEPKYKINPDHASLHVSQGNTKIGKEIWSFSTLPGNQEHMLTLSDGTLLTDVPGTCSKFCDGCFNGGCYAVRDAKLHNNATIPAWGENTILLRSGRLWDELETFLTLKNGKAEKILADAHAAGMDPDAALREAQKAARVKIFRIHVSGELEDVAQLRRWNLLALAHPEIRFGIYTKNYDALAEFLDEGADFAPNLVVNVSEWHGVAKPFLEKYSWAKLNVFVYDDHADPEVEALPHCPAVTREGHHALDASGNPIQCSVCRRCYTKTGRMTAVHAH